jgi:hypothetical protein
MERNNIFSNFILLAVAALAIVVAALLAIIVLLTAAGNVAAIAMIAMHLGGMGSLIPTSPGGALVFLFVPLGILIACFYMWEQQTGNFLEFLGAALGILLVLAIPGSIVYVILKKSAWPDLSGWTIIPLGIAFYLIVPRLLSIFDKRS